MDENIRIYEVCDCKEAYVEAVNALLKQLSSSPHLFTAENLSALVGSESSHLFFVECDFVVVGMLTLGEYLAPTGRKMWIEDVVVDETMRGHSLGRMLVEHAIDFAEKNFEGTLMLTSRPSRVVANNLYRSCGFKQKETNMYRMEISRAQD